MRYQRPKGTTDILPAESARWAYVESVAREVFKRYHYDEIRTPMFESFDVFSRTSGETSDVVTKEMYDFLDKGDRHISLRPEGTAGVVRAFVENKLYGPDVVKPVKVFYMGPMFRYERPQSGRLREFHQIGVEAFGSDSPAIDVETIAMGLTLLNRLGIQEVRLAVNTLGDLATRTAFREALITFLEPHYEELSEDSKTRLHKNPLRVLDSKDASDQKIVADAPNILEYLTPAAEKHFNQVQELLDALGIHYVLDPTMVRGLDYYNHTIFEFMVKQPVLGNDYTTICAGGRYNGLVEELGGPEMAGVGFALGVERLLLLMAALDVDFPVGHTLDVYVVGIGDVSNEASLKIVESLREQGYTADRDYLSRKPKAQFKTADKLGARYTITVGEEELKTQTIQVKEMASGNEVTVPFSTVTHEFAEVLKTL